MARGAQKRIASGNAAAVTTLTYGFLVSNTVYLLGNYWLWRSPASFTVTSVARYAVTEAIAAFLGWQLTAMARAGEDLAQSGLTAYMFDVVYITWFVHVASTLVSRAFWWTYAVVGRLHSPRSRRMPPTCCIPTSCARTCLGAARRPPRARRCPRQARRRPTRRPSASARRSSRHARRAADGGRRRGHNRALHTATEEGAGAAAATAPPR